MTIVGAFRVEGTPVLIGDMALMKGEMRSLRKKAYLISPNFVIAWAGHMIVARSVISALKTAFGDRPVTRIEIEEFLGGFAEHDFGRLHTNFVGWIVDEGEHCFLWNCLYPKKVFYGDYYFEGTGEKYFENIQHEQQSWHSGGTGLSPADAAVIAAINAVARARFEESLYRETWDISFGASYDILVLLDGRFGYIGSIVYLGWDYHWNSALSTGRLENAPVVIKHNSLREFSILQESLQGQHFVGRTTNYLSRPVYDDMAGANLSRVPLQIDRAADYFANYFIFRENGRVPFKILLGLQRPTADGPMHIRRETNGAYFFDFDTGVLDRIFLEQKAREAKS
jgi:hypothetical protein